MRWSKLDKDWRAFVAEGLDVRLRCSVVRMASERGSAKLPRYYIVLGGKVVWDYPGQFAPAGYPHATDVPDISQLVRDYMNAPPRQRASGSFPEDAWGLVDCLRAMDRRSGRRRLEGLLRATRSEAARTLLRARLALPPAVPA